jgi:tyrosine-protein kinase Etk/Wzc|tara:strand:+ start:6636 stop:8984 length:2349 start_codon:yes stop_codon:yes gene_type:complete
VSGESFFITKEFDAQVVKTVLRRKWWIPVLCIVSCLTITFFYLRYTKPVYESSMVIQLANNDKAKELLNIDNINSDASSFNSNIELLRSQMLFEKALKKLNVSVSLYQEGKILTEEKYTSSSFNVQPYELKDSSLINVPIYLSSEGNQLKLRYDFKGKTYNMKGKFDDHIINHHFDIVIKVINRIELDKILEKDLLFFTFNSIESLSSRLLSNLTVSPLDPNAQTIDIRFDAYNAVFCKDLINSLTSTFFSYDLELKKKGAENILLFIDNQLDSLNIELKTSKDSLVSFQRKSNLSDPDGLGVNLSNNAGKLQDQLFLIEDELSGLNSVMAKLNAEPNRLEIYRLLPEMLGKSYESSLSSQIEALHEQLERKENLLFSVTEDNPEIKSLTLKIASRAAGIRKSVSIVQNRLVLNAKVIRAKLGGIEADMMRMPEKKMEYGRLKNIQDLNDKYFSLLTEKKVMYAISNAGFSSTNRILSRAAINSNPIEPNQKKLYSAFLGFGFLLGMIILFLSYVRFNEVNYMEDLKKILPKNISYLGSIPQLKNSMDFSEILVHESPKSMISEAMRNIRTNLNFVSPDYQTIAISSSVSGEGKTFVSLNLAAIIAMTGKKTILIDLDLRKPKVHIALKSDNKLGMSNALIKQNTWQECVQHSQVTNLDFLTSGPTPPNPSELILGKKMEEIIEGLKEEYEVIVIDNPPVGVVSDGVKLLSESDIPIYVFKSHFSKRSFAERVEELIEVQQIKNLSVILNGEVGNRKSYGYNYEYYSEEEKPKSFISRILGK